MGSPYGRRTHDEADRILGLCSRSRHEKPDGRVELEGRPRRGAEAINVPSPSRPMVSFPDPRASHPYHMHDMIRSQPGFAAETLRRVAEAAGGGVLGMSGPPATPMQGIADRTLVIGSTHDRSWANTMSYTTQLTAFAALAARPGGPTGAPVARGRRELPSAPQAAACNPRETCTLPASWYPIEQLLHGPFLSLSRDDSIVALLSREDRGRTDKILEGLAGTGARVTRVGGGPGVQIPLPSIHHVLRPIVSVVPLQFLAYYAALERKADPDIMRSDVARYQKG